ncbi:hypothetical protein DFJ74DRAFT_404387 [Hyaloraphidium curvatum]|nr:hypothetical protein DFJ74DRAFT_404387 [Hyaloraphidium curvatum]
MDYTTGRTRGYGFACFKNREDAARAIEEKNGSWLGGRSVRVSWGSRGLQPDGTLPPTSSDRSQKSPGRRSSLQEIRTQSPITNTTVYIANIPQMQTDTEVARLFEPFGLILDIRQQWARGYAFVTMENHESASRAIHSLNGAEYCGRKLKCSWGREKWGYGMEAEPLIYDAFGNGFVGDPNALADGWVFPAMQQQYVDGSESDTESIPGGVTYPMYPQQVYFIPGMVAPQYAEAMY